MVGEEGLALEHEQGVEVARLAGAKMKARFGGMDRHGGAKYPALPPMAQAGISLLASSQLKVKSDRKEIR